MSINASLRLFIPKVGMAVLQTREIEQVIDLRDGYGGQDIIWSDWEDVPVVREGDNDEQN